jgi:ParB-like chromosome segregation protein Spo0J
LKAEYGEGDQFIEGEVEVEVGSLSVGGSPRLAGTDPEHVETLAAAQTPLPPIIVHRGTMHVIDGAHRLMAARLHGLDKISVRFFDGDEADAFVLSVKSNIAHGLPLSIADRKRAAGRIIASHPQWSDRRIASVTGIDPGTVAEIRSRRPGGPSAERKRVGQDGRVRPINGAEGRRLAAELITANPGLSLRQIGQAAGISPETARDVRHRIRQGEDPLPKRGIKHLDAAAEPAVAPYHRAPLPDRAKLVERLRADPSLRFTDTGRNLLRLLSMHMLSAEEWEQIIDNIPAHCGGIMARLAEECAGMWRQLAAQVEHNIADSV